MSLPDEIIADTHYQQSLPGNAYFSLRVANANFTFSIVTVFTGVGLEVGQFGSPISGLIQCDSSIATSYTGNSLFYDQEFLDPTTLSIAELDAATGEVNIPSVYASSSLKYMVEYLVPGVDTDLNPIGGSVYLRKPLRTGQIVEASYYRTDTAGTDKKSGLITEFLPVFVRLEVATQVNPKQYAFNPASKTVDQTFSPQIWVGSDLQNYSGVVTAAVNYAASLVDFTYDVPAGSTVKMTYAVYEALGGEQALSVSQPPVWQPPFWLYPNQSVFTLEGDRTSSIPVGSLVVVGNFTSYVQSVSLNASGQTEVEIYPTSSIEVGSRSPGRDPGLQVSDRPVQISKGGSQGFMQSLPGPGGFSRTKGGANYIFIDGDVTSLAKPNHILQVSQSADVPYLITGAEIVEGGKYTKVSLGTPMQKGYNPATTTLSFSLRPVYPQNPLTFNVGTLASTEATVIRFSPTGLGKALESPLEYAISPSGDVTLQTPTVSPLGPLESLYGAFTKARLISPVYLNGGLFNPGVKAGYLTRATPSDSNRLLGSVLRGSYQYFAPDRLYIESLPMSEFLGDVVIDASRQPESGVAALNTFPQPKFRADSQPSVTTQNARNNAWEFLNYDAGARIFLSLYNEAITAFEQIIENISGGLIGDRDGKFKFDLGASAEFPLPGGIYDLTSQLNPRLIWREVLDAGRVSTNWYYEKNDPVFDPRTGYAVDPLNRPGQSDGLTPDPDTLDYYLAQQKPLIRNDVDDVILEGFGRPVGRLISIFPKIDVPGVFSALSEPSQFSRLYPEQSRYFLRLNPGLAYEADPETGEVFNPGFYSAGRLVGSSVKRTRNKFIGQISNPVFGAITLISDTTARDRGPRARLWAYYPAGSASLDAALVAAGVSGSPTLGRAAFIVTPLFLNDFIIDQTTGYPDFAQLITQGGDLPDANSGDPELSTPGFSPGDQILWGRPDASVYSVYGPEVTPGFRCSVLVDEVIGGAVILVKDPSGNALSGTDLLFDSPDGYLPQREDTIFTPSSQASVNPGSYADPPTIEQGTELAKTNGDYRIQNDLKVRSRKGQLVDASLPVEQDIWGIPVQEWSGQNPPRPLTCVEGEVEFANREVNPVEIPALKGEAKDDSGDCQIPYLGSSYTEIQLLSSAEELLSAGLYSDTPAPAAAVYPDEIPINDGEIYGAVNGLREPAVLYTIQDLTPVGAYLPNTGVGNADKYDLLLVQTGQTPVGICGIQSIGDVTTDSVEPPRFITKTRRGDTHRYTARNLFAHKGSGLTGLRITEVGTLVTFDFSNVPGIILDDGSNTGVGGLDTLVNLSPGNALVINVYDPNPLAVNAYLGSVTINNTGVLSPAYLLTGAGVPVPTVIVAPGWFLSNSTTVQVGLFASVLGSLGLVSGQNYDFTITLDTYCDSDTANVKAFGSFAVGSGAGSTRCTVQADRLTFDERVSFASALPRNSHPANADSAIELGLQFNLWESPVTNLGTASNVNAASSINGGAYLTFVDRTYGVGQFTAAGAPGAGDELGSVRLMSWEGNNNTPITATGLIASALPSSNRDENGFIYLASGVIPDPDNTLTLDEPATWITGLSSILGAESNILPGDIVTVADGDVFGVGAVKSGTYLVRHVIPDDGLGFHAITKSTSAGSLGAFALKFPVFKSCNAALLGGTAVLSQVEPATHSPTGCVYASSGYLYALVKDQWASWDGAVYTVDPDSVFRVAYSAVVYDAQTKEATFTLSAIKQKADGSALTAAELNGAVQSGITRASGFTLVPVTNLGPEMPPHGNVVGLGVTQCGGFEYITIGNRSTTGASAAYTWQSGVDLIRQLTGAVVPGANQIGLRLPNPDSNNFHAERDYVVFGRSGGNFADPVTNPIQGVVSHMDLSQVTWDSVHFTGLAPANNLDCLLPGDEVAIGDDLDLTTSIPGFYALSGLFLEPSFARPVTNLSSATPHVTSASYSPTIGQVGIRPSGGNETVIFQVKRVRRWHDVSTDIYSKISGLRYAYEIRRGPIAALIPTPTLDFTSLTGTQLGFFDDPLVNIHPGDVLRVLDANGALLDTAEVAQVVSQTQLLLRLPGLTQDLSLAASFEVYLQTPPVPHEQSCEQLIKSLTNEFGGGSEIADLKVDYSSYPFPSGGSAPDWGLFLDDVNLDATKVQVGDYLIVDPAGELLPSSGESGTRPLGDRSVTTRAAYLSGRPAVTDDNRGFYRITGKDTTTIPGKTLLVLDGATRFAGGDRLGSDDVIFGDASAQYALLPTVHASLAEAGQPREGQNIMRITAPSVAGVFSARVGDSLYYSIEPFGYKIIRPSGIYSREAVETALFNRERILSWMGVLENAWLVNRGGDYWVFQDEDHIDDLPSPTDDTVGAGVLTNLFVNGIRGLVSQAPFESDSDGLSILDRRVSVRDYQLDYATPPGGGLFYTALRTNSLEQRPVLVDAIDDVLANEDDFRGTRYAWLAYRTNRENGTLSKSSAALKSIANIDKARRLASKRR
jgi:hypothetical protein